MYKVRKPTSTRISIDTYKVGETIETKMTRILTNQEPITDGAPLQYTERQEGVKPEYDVRTDRFELAVDAMTQITKDKLAKRKEILEEKKKKEQPQEVPKSGDPSL